MAVRTSEEIMETLRTRVGEDTSDDALSFIEDVQDTLNSLSNNDNENWKQKYEENDAQWRQKYRDRFFSGVENEKLPPEAKDPEPTEPDRATTIQVNDLFTEV